MGITLSQAGPGGIPFAAGDDAETAMLDGESSITTGPLADVTKTCSTPGSGSDAAQMGTHDAHITHTTYSIDLTVLTPPQMHWRHKK